MHKRCWCKPPVSVLCRPRLSSFLNVDWQYCLVEKKTDQKADTLSGYLCCIIYFIYRRIRRGCPGCCQRVFGNDKTWRSRLFKSEEGQTPDSPFTYFNASLQMYLSIITIDNPNVYSILSCNAISHIYKRQFSEDIR